MHYWIFFLHIIFIFIFFYALHVILIILDIFKHKLNLFIH